MKNNILVYTLILLVWSCKKPPIEPAVPEKYSSGIVALNEGLFEQNNASLSYYEQESGLNYQQVFKSENDRGLGDTANDIEVFSIDGKDYLIIAVDISSQLEIVERYTLKSVKQIPLFNGSKAREPRRIQIYGDKAFVCNFDGTVAVINLNNFSVEAMLTVGENPDGMTAIGSILYVTNSGGLNFPNYDSTVSVINMNSNMVVGEFDSRINCGKIFTDSEGDIYIHSVGNYDDVQPALLRVDAETYEIKDQFEGPIGSISKLGDWLYFQHTVDQAIYRFNMSDETFDYTPFINISSFSTFGGIQMDLENEQCYLFDLNGYVNSSIIYVYDLSGVLKYSFTGGLVTKKVIQN
jgi:hypothetical protein